MLIYIYIYIYIYQFDNGRRGLFVDVVLARLMKQERGAAKSQQIYRNL